MNLPNAEKAVVDIVKIRDYCLSQTHIRGRHKARVFAATTGLAADQAETVRSALLEAARRDEASLAGEDAYGRRYVLDFELRGPAGTARVRSFWIIRVGEDVPRFTTCYVL